jgi:hypothetical protein
LTLIKRLATRLIYRTDCTKTTWSFRLAVVAGSILLISLTKGFWIPAVGRSLVCNEAAGRADAILIENFDPDYLLFERAQALRQAGSTSRVFVPVEADFEGEPSRVKSGFIEVMTRVARLDPPEIIPIHEVEPISLNAAKQIRAVLTREHIRSVMVLTPGLRSRRSFLVYHAVLGEAGIDVSCVPVFGENTPKNWSGTWHGIQEVTEQLLKLQYYRFYVLPVYGWKHSRGERG